MNKIKSRNINIDLVKCIAVLSVISVHFFLHIDYYSLSFNNTAMYISSVFRTVFMICVPLFMLTTGYLMINKELSLKYYRGIIKTVSIYILASISCIIYKCLFKNEVITFKQAISGILSYKTISYSWYIEMYIGLFIMIPFLNLIYNNLKTDKQKYTLIITMICLTALPSLFNYYQKIIPAFWINLYPITYYFIGAHFRKNNEGHSNKWRYLFLFVIIILVSSFINIKISYTNKHFICNALNDWYGIQNVFSSICLFLFISRVNLENIPKTISFCITQVSKYSLGIYLSSYILDDIIYKKFNAMNLTLIEKFKYFIIVVGCVFIGSLLLSVILNFLYTILYNLCCFIYNKFRKYRLSKKSKEFFK